MRPRGYEQKKNKTVIQFRLFVSKTVYCMITSWVGTHSDWDQHTIVSISEFASLHAVFLIRRQLFVAQDRGKIKQTWGKSMIGISPRELFLKETR